MKIIHPIRIHTHYLTRVLIIRRLLIAIVAVSTAALVPDLLAQGYPSRLLPVDPSSPSTVSTNQLLTPKKALQAAQRARNHLLAGRVDEAQKEITHALDISPNCALAHNIQGAIHLKTGHYENAGDEFHRAIQADPALGVAYLGLGMSLIAQDRFEEALDPLDRAAHFLPGAWLIYFDAALTHLKLGDINAALKEISYAERLTAMDPERISGTDYLRGMICVKIRDYDRAKKYLEDAVACDPSGFYAAFALRRLEHLRQFTTIVK